jgi:hypothetical protein
MRRLAFLSLSLCACAPVYDHMCTDVGCQDGLSVRFERDSFEPGVYAVEIDLHGEFIHCQATIPLESDASDGCDDPRAMLYLSGSMLAVEEQRVEGFVMEGTDIGAMAVTVTLDGIEIGYAAFEPDYQELQPNGPECEPTCLYAEREIELD